MKLLIVFAVIAAVSCEIKWDDTGKYRLIDTEPAKYRLDWDPLLDPEAPAKYRLVDWDPSPLRDAEVLPAAYRDAYPWPLAYPPLTRTLGSPFTYSYKQIVRNE